MSLLTAKACMFHSASSEVILEGSFLITNVAIQGCIEKTLSLTLFLLLKKIWNLCSLTIQQRLCVFLLRSAYCSSFPPIHWPPCPFHFTCCCIPVLLSFTKVSDIPGNLSSVFAVWKKCSEENENKTELDQSSIQPRILSLTREREACRSMFNTWAGFSCSLQTICSLGASSAGSDFSILPSTALFL